MENDNSKDLLQYQALSAVVLAGTAGLGIETVARKGLSAAIDYIDLVAGALLIWDDDKHVIVKAIEAVTDADRDILLETEDSILYTLRTQYLLGTAYFELGGDEFKSVFSVPVEIEGKQFGALVGIKYGRARLHDYDEFLRSLAAALALASGRRAGGELGAEEIKKKIAEERNAAQEEIAVAVNHHINNPLTALLGNLQLLSLKHKELPEDILRRLTIIEESARQISEVTKRLMTVSEAESTEYINGTRMTDLLGEPKKKNETGEKKEETDEDSSYHDKGDEEGA